MVRAGLFLYDRLGGARTLPGAESLDLRDHPTGAPLRAAVRRGFAYSDCRTDDARLTIVSACDAARRGAEITTRTAFVAARREGKFVFYRLADDAVLDLLAAARRIAERQSAEVEAVLRRYFRDRDSLEADRGPVREFGEIGRKLEPRIDRLAEMHELAGLLECRQEAAQGLSVRGRGSWHGADCRRASLLSRSLLL